MDDRLLLWDIIVFHEYFDSVIRSKMLRIPKQPRGRSALITNSFLFKKKFYSMQICWYGIIKEWFFFFSSLFPLLSISQCNICMTLDPNPVMSPELRENVCFCAQLPPKFTLPGEIMAYIVMLKRLVFTEWNKGELVAAAGRHWLDSSCRFYSVWYQWLSSSSALEADRDQTDSARLIVMTFSHMK